jgi:hypothetical protein
MTPSFSARSAGLATGCRVSSLTIWKTSLRGRPAASAAVHPVRFSATGFMYRTRPCRSVEIRPSPALENVIRSSSLPSSIQRCARRAASPRPMMMAHEAT